MGNITVSTRCPRCADYVHFRTKVDNFNSSEYDYRSVPVDIAKAFHGSVKRCPCAYVLELTNPTPIVNVRMSIK